MSNTSKRDHYLPQFYLNFFLPESGPKVFWVYDKRGGDPRDQTPINTGVEGGLYRLETPGITDPKIIDTAVFQPNESVVKPIIERLLSSDARLSDDVIPVLAEFFALMHMRVPRTQKMVKEVGGAAVMQLLSEMSEDPDEAEFKTLLEQVKGHYNIELTKNAALPLSVLSVPTIIQQLQEMNWCLCRAPHDTFFITGDAPTVIFLLEPDGQAIFGQGLSNPTVEVTFPLSPTKCLYLCRKKIQKYWPMNKKKVTEFNRRIAFMAERFIISPLRSNDVAKIVRESAVTIDRPKVDQEALLERFKTEQA